MKKGGINKGDEFIYKLTFNDEFVKDIEVARIRFKIPQRGVTTEEEYQKIVDAGVLEDINAVKLVGSIKRKFKIPLAYSPALECYLFFGADKNYLAGEPEPDFVSIQSPRDNFFEKLLDEKDAAYVKILVLENGTKNDVLKCIENKWHEVEEIFKKQGATKPKRVRQTPNKERTWRIRELWRKPINELRRTAETVDPARKPFDRTPKDILIQIILRSEFGQIDDGYIRKIGPKKYKPSP